MSDSKHLVEKYINSHQALDLEGMYSCMDQEYKFSDLAFPDVDTRQSKGMWSMFITNKDINKMKVKYSNLQGSGLIWTADYVVDYIFNGRPVTNHIHTKLTLSPTSGLILLQEDTFDFWTWSQQSLGVVGLLFGWTSFLQNKVSNTAQQRLEAFLKKQEHLPKL